MVFYRAEHKLVYSFTVGIETKYLMQKSYYITCVVNLSYQESLRSQVFQQNQRTASAQNCRHLAASTTN